ncbi:MAG: chemotaxis protein CheA [Planctomycetaceae bacterium]
MNRDDANAAAHALLSRIGLEVAFIGPDASAGTATLASLLDELAGAVASAPAAIVSQVDAAREWLGIGTGADDLVVRFGTWHPWMEEAVTAWERGQPLPVAPVWASSVPASAHPSARAADPTAARSQDDHAPPAPGRRLAWDDPAMHQDVAVLPDGMDLELVTLFCAEAEELLRDVEQGVLVLERQPDNADTIATVFRAFHTLKGNAAVMKMVVLQGLAHEVESLLDAARRGTMRLDRRAVDVILAGADDFSRFVAEAARQADGRDVGRTIPLPVQGVIDAVHAVLAAPVAGPVAAAAESGDERRDRAPLAPPAAEHATIPAPPAAPPAPGPTAQDDVPVGDVRSGAVPPPVARQDAAATRAPSGGLVRVDTRKLDALVDLVGELVIAESMVVQGTERSRSGDEHLSRSLARLHGITADLQRTAMTLRMVPIRATFQKMSRLVRDASTQLGKRIRLVLEGEETELDRTVVEEIGDPLVHMIRNAIDHGIEGPDGRLAAGKEPEGTVTLRAYHRGGHVVIEIADDGRGLDPARIRARAVERGLVAADAVLENHAAFDLIFAPGFSTAETITDLSGRGVGMDVARRNIERIRGTIRIDSRPGLGTTFTVAIPLTLAIIEGLLVAVGDQRYVIPTLAVCESFRPAAGAVSLVHGRGEVVSVRGRLVPVLRLARHFGVSGGVSEPTEGILVAVEVGSEMRCLLVDALVGKQEVVIKGLGETFAGRAGFAGAAILGDGRVGLILDPAALVRRRSQSTETAA